MHSKISFKHVPKACGRAGNWLLVSFTSKEMDRVCFQRKQVSLTHCHPSKHCCVVRMSQSFDLCVLPLPCCSSVRSGNGTFRFSIAVPVWKGRKSIFRNRAVWPSLFFCLLLDFLQTQRLCLGTLVLKSLLWCNGSFTSWFIYPLGTRSQLLWVSLAELAFGY